ncbi:tail protein X [Zymobacter palmae]|uniref:P2-like prophage tailprotein X n=1 Tax=Zymobacter palmae TaxID=33074 RepID=A0A348HHH4_9GAMM|nr:tail protein X [Zymobacter palmae]BBG31076.1 P2-like prophage tailprotein X [Zymobacter palmae]
MWVRTRAGDTVNALLYRETGRSDDDAEEALWSLNLGLAEYGPILPAGVIVRLPVLEARDAEVRQAVTVWD